MKRLLIALAALVFAGQAQADNYTATAGTGLTFGAKNVAGILFPYSIPTDTSGAALFSSANPGRVNGVQDNTAFTYGTTPLFTIGGVYNSSITAVTNGYQGAFAMTANRSIHSLDDNSAAMTTSLSTIAINTGNPVPLGTTNGWTPKLLNALTNSAVAVKASGGWLGLAECYNPNATVAYIQIYNIASGSVSVGVSTPLLSIGISPTSMGGIGNNTIGVQFGTAIAVAATTTATGGSAPSTALDCNATYN